MTTPSYPDSSFRNHVFPDELKRIRQRRRIAEVEWQDESTLISAANDHTVRVWDAGSGESIRELVGHTQAVLSVAFSPDGRRLASGSRDQTLRIWDAETGAERRGPIGAGEARLMKARDLVDFAVDWMAEHRAGRAARAPLEPLERPAPTGSAPAPGAKLPDSGSNRHPDDANDF